MTKVSDAISRYSAVLQAKFTAVRGTVTDSDIKGGLNERIVAEFLDETVPHWFVATNAQILDCEDNVSDEVDVCVCNDHQVFIQTDGGVLLADGVDYVIQVKTELTDSELNRAFKNCASVKALKRSFDDGDTLMAPDNMPAEWCEKIPYCVFAFSSSLAPKTVQDRLVEKSKGYDLPDQIDAVFVLDRGETFVNCRDGKGTGWKQGSEYFKGWLRMESAESTLFELIRFSIQSVPRFGRARPPIRKYFGDHFPYPVSVQV